MRTRASLLRDAYPALLFILLLTTWELGSQGYSKNIDLRDGPAHEWHRSMELIPEPACKATFGANESERACKPSLDESFWGPKPSTGEIRKSTEAPFDFHWIASRLKKHQAASQEGGAL